MHVSRAATGFGIQNFGKQWGWTQYFRGYSNDMIGIFFPILSLGDTAWLCFCKPSLLQRGKCQICKASQPPIHVHYLLDVKHILIWPAWTERGLSNTARLSVASDYVTLVTTPLHHSRLSRRARTEGHGHPQCAWSAPDLCLCLCLWNPSLAWGKLFSILATWCCSCFRAQSNFS